MGLALDAPAILSNGGLIYDFAAEKSVSQVHLPPIYRELTDAVLAELPDVGIALEVCDKKIILRENYWMMRHFHIENFPYEIRDNVEEGTPINKLLLACAAEDMPKLRKFATAREYAGTQFVQSSNCFFEMMPAGVDKGRALENLAEILDIPREEIAAIGDYDNDASML